MLTLFTIPKPFRGHTAVIQRNAIQSWLQLRPACEIILLGSDEGTAEAARAFGLNHLPDVSRNEFGTPLINSIFELAQSAASNRLLCYINADIVLLGDFLAAVLQPIHFPSFLMAGNRWDLDLNCELDFTRLDWETDLRQRVAEQAVLGGGIDYFVFKKGLWGEIPPFAIGRTAWDNWLIYRARAQGAAVIDITQVVTAIHQNHDYTHIPRRDDVTWKGPEAVRNLELAGGLSHEFSLKAATHLRTPQGLRLVLTEESMRRRLYTLRLRDSTIGQLVGVCWPVFRLFRRPVRKAVQLWAAFSNGR
jgi:hypothetical protein